MDCQQVITYGGATTDPGPGTVGTGLAAGGAGCPNNMAFTATEALPIADGKLGFQMAFTCTVPQLTLGYQFEVFLDGTSLGTGSPPFVVTDPTTYFQVCSGRITLLAEFPLTEIPQGAVLSATMTVYGTVNSPSGSPAAAINFNLGGDAGTGFIL